MASNPLNCEILRCSRCETHVVVTDLKVAELPRRRTDAAMILIPSEGTFRFNLKLAPSVVFVKRSLKLAEQQQHLLCTTCSQVIAYQREPLQNKSMPPQHPSRSRSARVTKDLRGQRACHWGWGQNVSGKGRFVAGSVHYVICLVEFREAGDSLLLIR